MSDATNPTFAPVLDQDQIFTLVENTLLAVVSTAMGAALSALNPRSKPITLVFEEAKLQVHVNALRALLREPLRDIRFARAFNDYFAQHPDTMFRECATNWLFDLLVYES